MVGCECVLFGTLQRDSQARRLCFREVMADVSWALP
jgi:hypothetical protein